MKMNNIIKVIQEFFCGSCLNKISTLEEELANSKLELNIHAETISRFLADESDRATFWNNKWAKNKVTYKAQEVKRDVRNLIPTKSYLLPNLKTNESDDALALKTLKFVKSTIKYKGDLETHKMTEFWQHPEETYQTKVGDCEDGALLIASLLRIAGVPAYKVKICAGWVKTADTRGGHCYVIYLAEDDNWYVLDWCYYGTESQTNFKKIPHKDNSNYEEIWWTANDKYTWSQKSTVIN